MAKIAQGECRGKLKTQFLAFATAEPPFIFCKDDERRVLWQIKNAVFVIFSVALFRGREPF
ncbi:MAG: hypothetical protein IJY00_06115 [Bacteroidaceae bacterium]|nr:hypothetical protein [Bacteroidaceae bacterium]